jgi:hypothetical protein
LIIKSNQYLCRIGNHQPISKAGMKSIICLFVFTLIAQGIYSQVKSNKRGVAYGYHSAADMNTASAGISWWYNWSTQPDAGIRTTYPGYNVDFTPQAWNAAGINGVRTWVSQDDKVKYILGFNEPNFKSQANMTPTQAAAAWPQLQAIADEYGLKLVSPAVNYCGDCVSENGTVYSNPFKWLDDFFTACVGCRVDYIALHWYGGGNSMTSYVNDARKYNKPIWITEFANWDGTGVTPESQKSYLAGTTNFLERDPDIFRYSWFIGRSSGGSNSYPYLDLYSSDGNMTALGQIYLNIPVYDSNQVFQIPGRIQAEEYYRQSGIFSEITSDSDGFMNIGYTESGDWLIYKINVSASGTYTVTSRYAGTTAGKFDIYVDNVKKVTITTTNTSGWQNWSSVSVPLNLDAGKHILKLQVVTQGFNLNWLDISKGAVGIQETNRKQWDASVYPNPVTGKKFRISFNQYCPGEATIQLKDLSGKIIYLQKLAILTGREIEIDLNNMNFIGKGVYNLVVSSKEGSMNRKIVLL